MITATLEKRVTKTESNLEKLEKLVSRLSIRVDTLVSKMDKSNK